MVAANQAIRNGDYRHRQLIGRQRKHAASSPAEQAQAVACIIRKRLADSQPLPDLDAYNLSDDAWTELVDLLGSDELMAVTHAGGQDDVDPYDPAELARRQASLVDTLPESTIELAMEATNDTLAHVPSWRDHEPPVVHSLKWCDAEGIEHLHVVRADTLDEALLHIRKAKACIDAARAKASEVNPRKVEDDRPQSWCAKHKTPMKQRCNTKGRWYSHQLEDGSWCRGQSKS